MQQKDRLHNIVKFLWERGVEGTTIDQIVAHTQLKKSSHLRSLLKELIQEGLIVQRPGIQNKNPLYYAVHSSLKSVEGSSSPTPVYFPLDTWTFDNNHCFLCGTELNSQNQTQEHIFPKWLQRKYNLYNQNLILLNGTTIPYSRLTIPSCWTCNHDYLSPLENTIQKAHDAGFEEFRQLPPLQLYQWLSKIYYGILFRELSLFRNRADPLEGKIFTEDQLREFGTLHHFLQSVRLPLIFRGFHPWSIFVLKTLAFGDNRDFDYKDSLTAPIFCIRMGRIAIIAVLEDTGAQEFEQHKYFEDIDQLQLHPIQFEELCAHVMYSASLMTRTPTYVISVSQKPTVPTEVVCVPLMGLSRKPLFSEWDHTEYSHLLHSYWAKHGFELDQIHPSPRAVLTFLTNANGDLLQMDTNDKVVEFIKSKFLD